MNATLLTTIGLLILGYVFAAGYLYWAFSAIQRRRRIEKAKIMFGRAVASVIRGTRELDDQIAQLERHYETRASILNANKSRSKSFDRALWTLIEEFDTQENGAFAKRYGSLTIEDRNRLYAIVVGLERRRPFAKLSPRWANRLQDIATSLENGDAALGRRSVDELFVELTLYEETREKIEKERDRKHTAFQWAGISATIIAGIIGVALTIVYAN
ncbi:hypothetical protein [Nonomuraea basaltis]|uniref:hypothetical protein n=1 Tax=Nonomuraea basaltis TaxID=2495887 RepID=UPI00110C5DCF|nr:hypothetical protein [Nonomuraea basaltis]TMR89548.1 hypothetical protein EJK15_60120 [Nonomuraea basaltis]